MGWGTFIASRALRRPSSSTKHNWEHFFSAYEWLAKKFISSYKERVIAQSVLVHPTIITKTDDSEWQIDLQKRAVKDWAAIQIAVVLYYSFLLILGAGLPALPFIPLVWYYCKYRAIKMSAKDINKQFMDVGYNVKELLEQMPEIYEENKNESQKRQKKEMQKLIESQEAAYKRKFGIE